MRSDCVSHHFDCRRFSVVRSLRLPFVVIVAAHSNAAVAIFALIWSTRDKIEAVLRSLRVALYGTNLETAELVLAVLQSSPSALNGRAHVRTERFEFHRFQLSQ